MPYGHRTQVFTAVDTVGDNYFSPMSAELMPFMIRYVAQLYPDSFKLMFKEGLNKRLGIHDEPNMHEDLADMIAHS